MSGRILVVDDDEAVRRLIVRALGEYGWTCGGAADVAEARSAILTGAYELVLCDVGLPDGSGIDLIGELQQRGPELATLMVTARDDPALARRALDLGAYGYVTKPFSLNEILIQVTNAFHRRRLELESREHRVQLERAVADRTADLVSTLAALRHASSETIARLARAIEFRDADTSDHVERVGRHARRIALRLGLPPSQAELVGIAAPLHDVGKIAVRDEILRKRGALTDAERREMERHAEIGREILAGAGSELLDLAAEIAWTHHERWDGSGYPRALAGDEIPLSGRIVAVADVFDALANDRPYRPRFSVETARAMVRAERARAFDPDVVDAFVGEGGRLTLEPVERSR